MKKDCLRHCGGTRFATRVALFVWLFASIETIFIFHSSFADLPTIDPLHHNGARQEHPYAKCEMTQNPFQLTFNFISLAVGSSPDSRQLSDTAETPCVGLVKKRSNQLICSTLHSLWESFPPPSDPENGAVHRAVPNIIQRPSTVKENVIVLATHLGVQKLSTLVIQSRWWGGPISAAIYVKSSDEIDTFVKFVEEHEFTFRYTSFHVVMEKTAMSYPHNVLRNLAMDYLDGDFFVAADVDFIPTPDCHRKLTQLFALNDRLRLKLITKTVMVLAAFERHMPNPTQEVTEDLLPRNKAEVIEMVRTKKGNGFHMAGSSAGHGPTNYEKWMENKTNDFYGIEYKNIFEPYIMGYKHGIPRYWEGFRGYGYNKFSWFFEIHKAGYDFAVLRDFYVVHMNHRIPDLKKKNSMTDWNRKHWQKFKAYLSRQYKKTTS